ncbi:hypothetical protein EYF80_010015 [Liparis tanakae]|uniref:Uncharacterized protein n=1 Tax=Liparis tanakae TaxID=230148 RepID=A0A4Z2IPN8_9TELE|nr:hypothetical protein EYF80_010015 [Liparis tanakae]
MDLPGDSQQVLDLCLPRHGESVARSGAEGEEEGTGQEITSKKHMNNMPHSPDTSTGSWRQQQLSNSQALKRFHLARQLPQGHIEQPQPSDKTATGQQNAYNSTWADSTERQDGLPCGRDVAMGDETSPRSRNGSVAAVRCRHVCLQRRRQYTEHAIYGEVIRHGRDGEKGGSMKREKE